MILIIGGAYQGKRDYAVQTYRLREEEILDCGRDGLWKTNPEAVLNFDVTAARCIDHMERYLYACCALGKEAPDSKLFREDSILICEDISCGVVPVDATERAWREMTGRFVTACAKQAEQVVRLFCGIPTVLK